MTAGPIGIHTICHAPGMADRIDPAFLAFDVTDDPQPERRETAHMLRFWREGRHRDFAISGLLSPLFTRRTRLTGQEVLTFITETPGFDVWTINPYPTYFHLSYNIWEQGEAWHPGLRELAAQVFKRAKVEVDLSDFPRSTMRTLLFSNYWAGTPEFWDRFMPFVEHVSACAETTAGTFEPSYYVGRHAVFWPFLFERLFTTFLVMHPDIKVRYIPYSIDDLIRMTSANKLTAMLIQYRAPIIDRWDSVGTYNEEQRSVFRFLQSLHNYSLVLEHQIRMPPGEAVPR